MEKVMLDEMNWREAVERLERSDLLPALKGEGSC